MEIDLGKTPFNMDFHPSDHLVAAALITGDLQIYRYGADSTSQKLLEVKAHTESCRAVRFINGGQAIITGSSDRSILATDVETGAAIARLENAHEDAIFSLINVTESTIATGDDQGCMKVWDTRQRTCCNTFAAHDDYVSDMTYVSDTSKLLGTSGDGTLSVCNLRSNKIQTRSEFSEEELLSVVIMKNGRKVVCGSQAGTLLLYSWGFFKDCSDRFLGLASNSIDSMLKLDEDRLIAGCENGLISLVGILPNRVIQPLAEHSEDPIERLGFSHDRKFLGSISHDQILKLWDMEELLQKVETNKAEAGEGNASEDDSDGMDMDTDMNPPKSKKGGKRKNGQNNSSSSTSFFADM
ncbi:WD repeat-containing protein 55 [Linum grandiflorum]